MANGVLQTPNLPLGTAVSLLDTNQGSVQAFVVDPSATGSCVTNLTTNVGQFSCAENDRTVTRGAASFAAGNQTQANGEDSLAEGAQTTAGAFAAHAEGYLTLATAEQGHAEGQGTRAGQPLRVFTIAAGGFTVTISGNVTAEYAQNDRVTIFGTAPALLQQSVTRIVATVPAFAAGNTTFDLTLAIDATTTVGVIADAQISAQAHAEGLNTVASGAQSHAEGLSSVASGVGAHAEGQGTASGQLSHAEGLQTIASGLNGSHAEGQLTQATAGGAHAEGHSTQATAIYAHAEGDTTIASGIRAHSEGVLTTASGDQSHAEGFQTTSGGAASHTQGDSSVTSLNAEHAEASGKFAVLGDAQYRRCVVRGSTPGAAPAESVNIGVSGAATNTLQLGKAYNVTVRVIATLNGVGAAALQTAAFFQNFIASRRTGGVIDVSAVTAVAPLTVQGAAFVAATLAPSDGGAGNLNLLFTNPVGKTNNARIVGVVEYVEVLTA